MIRPKEVTLVSRTQPSGPLCLWQCLHYCRQRADLQRLQGKVQQGVNKNISTFGPYLAVQLDKPGQEFSLLTAIVEDDSVILNIVMEFNIEGRALIWKLWEETVMVVLRSGEIAVFSTTEDGEQSLLAKTEPNMLVMYQSPCFIFRLSFVVGVFEILKLFFKTSRDIFFCSSEVVSNSLARASYWLV